MNPKHKVTYTFYTDSNDAGHIDNLATAKKIRMAALAQGENMADWGRELEVSRQYIYQVVNGERRTRWVRDFIENRLGETFWPIGAEQSTEAGQ